MEESMRKLMHNMELLVVMTGKGNWRGAAEALAQARLLLDEVERQVQTKAGGEAEGRLLAKEGKNRGS